MQFSAHLEAIHGLARRMSAMADALGDEATAPDTSALGAGDAAGAMADFVSGWSHGRAEISDGLTTTSASLQAIAARYQVTDAALAASYDVGGG